MAGWALFAGLSGLAALALWRLRFPAALKTFVLAAIMLGAAGYAWQGRPGWAGVPTEPSGRGHAISEETIGLRNAMFGRFGTSASYLIPSDAMMRIGAADAAARWLSAGINRDPSNVALWTQLGTVIATRDSAVSPAADLAFRRAIALAPGEPAPWFFLGLAEIRSGRFVEARSAWARALALTPADFGYRPEIAARLALLDRLLAQR